MRADEEARRAEAERKRQADEYAASMAAWQAQQHAMLAQQQQVSETHSRVVFCFVFIFLLLTIYAGKYIDSPLLA